MDHDEFEDGLHGHSHSHDDFPDDPHDDLDDFGEMGTAVEVEGMEMLTIRSVGIDIGSSTSHLVFSKLVLRREGSAFSSRFRVTDRQVLYRSPIMLTPYVSGALIDTDSIREFVRQSYQEAGFTPETVDTGAVIITGEALKKENARPISELFAKESGKFICASAGPNHEALLAAHGCGAVALSKSENATVMNIDVGGGTTKLCLIRDGVVTSTAAITVGARLIAFDEANQVTRLEEPAIDLLKDMGHELALGETISETLKEEFAARMSELLSLVVQNVPLTGIAQEFLFTNHLEDYQDPSEVDLVVFSGGVSEYIYGHDALAYGDLGPQFARNVRERLTKVFKEGAIREAAEGIRATVIGAGEYTVQASGGTSHLSGVDSLPAFGLQVVRPNMNGQESVERAIQSALAKFDLTEFAPGLALALEVEEPPNYRILKRLADGISAVVTTGDAKDAPVFIVLDTDVAKSLGGILKEELKLSQDVIVVDGIDVGDLDYLDIGRPMGISEVVPVTVKSLIFPTKEES
jgi:ethanolamine utilization protein EutA